MGIRDVAKNKSYHSVADHEWRIDDDKNREQNVKIKMRVWNYVFYNSPFS
jgi:hypothetical protein